MKKKASMPYTGGRRVIRKERPLKHVVYRAAEATCDKLVRWCAYHRQFLGALPRPELINVLRIRASDYGVQVEL